MGKSSNPIFIASAAISSPPVFWDPQDTDECATMF
jgi:hypothetical protein